MRYLSLCSGIEAASVAWEPLGWTPVGFAEIDPYRSALLAHYWPEVPNLGDLTTITAERIAALGPIDVVIGGTPCQDLSVAGQRAGLAGSRSGLFFDYVRICDAARHFCGARWTAWENVPGALSVNEGRDFALVVGALAGCPIVVPDLGFGSEGVAVGDRGFVEWAVLDAQWFGVAQRRERVFAIVDFGDWASRPPILLERDSLRGDYPPRRETGAGVARSLTASPGGSSGKEQQHTFVGGDRRPLNEIEVSPPLLAGVNRTGGHRPPGSTVDNAESLIPEIAGTLRAAAGGPSHGKANGTDRATLVPEVAATVRASASRVRADCESTYVPELAEPLTAQSGGGRYCNGGNNPKPKNLVAEVAQTLTEVGASQCSNAGDNPMPRNLVAEVSPAITRKWAKGAGGPAGDECQNLLACFDEAQITHPENRSTASADTAALAAQARPPTVALAYNVEHGLAPHGAMHGAETVPALTSAERKGHTVLAFKPGQSVAAGAFYGTEEFAPTLQGAPNGSTAVPAVVFKASHYTRGKDGAPSEVAPPLTQDADRGDQDLLVQVQAVSLRGREGGNMPELETSGACPALRTGGGGSGNPMLLEPVPIQNATRGKSQNGLGVGGDAMFTLDQASAHGIYQRSAVRRLTPIECERLQGYPDGYTSVGLKGKPASDTRRYSALGDSMAVPVIRWIGRRIVAASSCSEP